MPSHTQPHVGDAIRLTRSGHSAGSDECGTVVAVLGDMLQVRWSEHLETFVPLSALRREARPAASRRPRRPATRRTSGTPSA
jgi:hypothetical protein